MARCNCGSECGCNLVAGDNVQVSGSGTPAVPWVVTALTDCEEVRGCLTSGEGTTYDPADGSFDVCVSGDVDNGLTRDANGCLYVQMGQSTVTTGCGLTGTGAPLDPVQAAVQPWPFACAPETNGSVIACDANGDLRGEPPYHSYSFQSLHHEFYPTNPLVPSVDDTLIIQYQLEVTNPDPCRAMRVMYWVDADVDFNMPVDSRAAWGIGIDEMYNITNRGTGAQVDQHAQLGMFRQQIASLAPGASTTILNRVTMGKGQGGATYNRIQGTIVALLVPA